MRKHDSSSTHSPRHNLPDHPPMPGPAVSPAPGPEESTFLYCLALGQRKYGIALHGLSVMSNHYHLTLTDVHGVLPEFMGWLNSQLAKRIKQLRRWDEVVWEPNVQYSAVELQGPREALDKVAYTLLNPVSAALVRRPEQWPGLLSTLKMLRRGKLDAKRPSVGFRRELPESLVLLLAPPPCFGDKATYHRALETLLTHRLETLHKQQEQDGRRVLGRRAVRKTAVHARPATRKPRFGRNPTFSALSRQTWRRAIERLRAFRASYRSAYEAWRGGADDVEFPAGTWWLARRARVLVGD